MEIFITGYVSHFFLHITQCVCNVNECRDFAVFAQIARCENVIGAIARLCVGNELFDLLFENDSAFENEFGVTRHRIVEITGFVVFVCYVLIAVIKREVVYVTQVPEGNAPFEIGGCFRAGNAVRALLDVKVADALKEDYLAFVATCALEVGYYNMTYSDFSIRTDETEEYE